MTSPSTLTWMLRRSTHTVTVHPAMLRCNATVCRPERIWMLPLAGTRASNSTAVASPARRGGSITPTTSDSADSSTGSAAMRMSRRVGPLGRNSREGVAMSMP